MNLSIYNGVFYMKNKIKIRINNTEYTLYTEKSEDYVKTIAEKLNSDLLKFLKNVPLSQAYIMLAFDYIDSYYEHLSKNNNLCDQMNKYIKENERLKSEIIELSTMTALNKDLSSQNKKLSKEIILKDTEINSLNKSLSDNNATIASITTENVSIKSQTQKAIEDDALKEENSKKILEKEIEGLTENLISKETEIERLNKIINELKEQNEKLKFDIVELEEVIG